MPSWQGNTILGPGSWIESGNTNWKLGGGIGAG